MTHEYIHMDASGSGEKTIFASLKWLVAKCLQLLVKPYSKHNENILVGGIGNSYSIDITITLSCRS